MSTSTVAVENHSLENERTVPNSPDNSEDDDAHGDYARLIPSNRAARIAFSEVVDMLRIPDSGWSQAEHEKYMHVGVIQTNLQEQQSGTDTETENLSFHRKIWSGWYRLNLEIPPANGNIGLVAGKGRFDLPNRGVDFLLTCSSIYGVHGRHARFIHRTSSKTLMIVAGRRHLTINGTIELKDSQQAITALSTGLSFGDLAYRLDFTSLNPKIYLRQLRGLNNLSELFPDYMSPTPASTDYDLRHYTVKGVFAEGSSCVMSSGVDKRTGALVAIKEMKRNTRNSQALQHEIEINQSIKPHPRICELVEVIYLDRRSSAVDKIYMIYSPLAPCSLQDLILSDMEISVRIKIFKQCIDGVSYIHSKKIMHRDIKPSNIIVVNQSPPRAMIIDFGQATWEESSVDHMVGTIRYMAPEAIALKRNQSAQPYTNTVDIWGLGLCGYQLFCYQTYLWKEIDKSNHEKMRKRLQDSPGAPNPRFYNVPALILLMVAWDSSMRISATEALKSEALSGIVIDDSETVIEDTCPESCVITRKRPHSTDP